MIKNEFVKKVIDLNSKVSNRIDFHNQARELLVEMGGNKEFWNEVFKQNLSDAGYLGRKWTMYEIPFFYVYENDDFYLKVHLFVPLKNYANNIAASAIHHHNNFLLTTFAAFGSGYETMLFEKEVLINPDTKHAKLKIREHFTQQERPVHTIDAWEPHVVINPTSLSATLILWSPDKKRITDNFRSNPLLKAFKQPLRKIIYAFGLDKKVGIAAKDTYQFYTKEDGFVAVPEDEFFEPTRKQSGAEVDDYSIQTVFAFMQRMGFNDTAFLEEMKKSKVVPAYYHKWIDMLLKGETIPDTFAKESINIPGGIMTVENIVAADKKGRELN